ncbi:MAG: MBL fold metallo-hydrolase [Akkermansiaceae bacterium]
MRSSVHIESATHSLLVDSGPDLRQQALRHSLTKVDAVLYTHQHLDHVAGFDELRAFCWRREDPLPLYSTLSCLNELKRVYDWAFAEGNTYKGYIRPLAVPIVDRFNLGDVEITAIPVEHGSVETIGYRFDDEQMSIAYIPDAKRLKPGSAELLANLDHFIIDCLREKEHPTHMSLAESLATIDLVKPKQAWLTHVAHEMDVEKVESILPSNVQFAYDTLTLAP